MDTQSKIILISGPTASGKSSFAVRIAKKINGEIINSDSMQIYKQLKILTARPNKKEQKNIKHHLYGIADVKINFSTGQWLKLTIKKIKVRILTDEDIQTRNLPIDTNGLVITEIEKDSPINYLKESNIIVEAQKKKIKSIKDLERIVESALKSKEKTMLIAIYNNRNQRRYIGVKLD